MIELKKKNNFYVISGGPGVGKTTLLTELNKRGSIVVPEIARQLIKEQQDKNGEALPWKNKELYKKLMFDRSVKSFEENDKIIDNCEAVFFDRGLLDTICYAKLINSEINQEMDLYAVKYRYNKIIFMLPPWEEIYETDSERKQDWKEAVLTFELMCNIYESYGYSIVLVPKVSVNERANFVLEFIEQNKNYQE